MLRNGEPAASLASDRRLEQRPCAPGPEPNDALSAVVPDRTLTAANLRDPAVC